MHKQIKEFFDKHQFLSGVIASLVATAIVTALSILPKIYSIPQRIKLLETEIVKLTNEYNILNDKINNSYSTNSDNMETNTYIINIEENLLKQSQDINDQASKLLEPDWVYSDIIAKNLKTNEEYTANQLANKKILFQYKTADIVNFFYGQFNENNHWDGVCIINSYENECLKSIIEAVFDDGKLKKYKKAISMLAESEWRIWRFSDRICKGIYSYGTNWDYLRYDTINEIPIQFELDKITIDNIIRVNDFEKTIRESSSIDRYYCGNTINDIYNDDTDIAYEIRYNASNETIKSLYIGRFKNGTFSDNTGEAKIIRLDNEDEYFYYKGNFEKGKRIGDVTKVNLTIDEIIEILDGITFNCELKWKGEKY